MKRFIVTVLVTCMAVPTWAMPVGIQSSAASDMVTTVAAKQILHHRPPHYRSHYRPSHYHKGVIVAGIVGGLLLGGIAASAARQHNASAWNNHVNWCSQRYRSYRIPDNTFQPYNGPRKQCVSPF
jgi:hypothetical protein